MNRVRTILTLYGAHFPTEYVVSDRGPRSLSVPELPGKHIEAVLVSIKVYPSQAIDHVVFDYTLSSNQR